MSSLLNAVLTFLFPVSAWLIFKKKTNAALMPLIIGLIAYPCVILPRSFLRLMISYNELRQDNILLYYIARGIISGGCEEAMRLLVFLFILKSAGKKGWINAVSYGLGHGACEILLTTDISQSVLSDTFYNGCSFLDGMAFSAAMSVLVYAAAVQADDKRLFWAAYGLHFCVDLLPILFEAGLAGFVGFILIDVLFTAACCFAAYKVYRKYGRVGTSDLSDV